MRGVDEVVRQRLVHIIDDVEPLWRYDGVFLSAQIMTERLQSDLVCTREQDRGRLLGLLNDDS